MKVTRFRNETEPKKLKASQSPAISEVQSFQVTA